MVSKFNRALLISALLVAAPFYALLIDTHSGTAAPKPLHIATLRQLAASLPGPAPSGVEVEVTASRNVVGDLVAAGSGLKLQNLVCLAWRLPVPGGGGVMIDSGLNEIASRDLDMRQYYPAAQARVEAALTSATILVATQERPCAASGFVALLRKTIAPAARQTLIAKTRLSAAQLPPAAVAEKLGWPAEPLPKPSLSGTGPQAVAPGVVVIPAPGQSPGSQLIYVRLANGQELLFAGGTAPIAASWRDLRPHSRLFVYYLGNVDRNDVVSWLLTIHQLAAEAPHMRIVPGQDSHWLESGEASGIITPRFSAPRQP